MERDEVLTAEEADALLKRVEGEEPPTPEQRGGAGEVGEVDITQWDRIVRGRVPALESINERFVGHARIGFFQLFRRPVEITSEQVAMVKWGEYVNSLPVPTSLNLVESSSQSGLFLVAFDAELVFEFVDAFFGGKGGGRRQPDAGEFTPTERRLTRNVVGRICEHLVEAWSIFLETRMTPVRTEINPQFAAIAGPADPVYVSRFRVEVGGEGGELHVVLPSAMVDPVRHFVNVGSLRQSSDKEFWKATLKEEVRDARVTLRTVLAEAEMDLGELTNLKTGDVIPIELPSAVSVFAGESEVLRGTFGVSRGYNAVKVAEILHAIAKDGSSSNDGK